MSGLDHPWDLEFLPDGTLLVTERDRERLSARLPSGEVRVLADTPPGVWHNQETGFNGIAVDPDFATNRTIYLYQGYEAPDGSHDARVTSWKINNALTHATQTGVVVSGISVGSGIHLGQHTGGRLRFAPDGALYITTGDAYTGTNPQDLTSLNGKTLRVDPATGGPWPGNPFEDSTDPTTQLIWTYGHRNVQGIDYRTGPPGVRGMWSVEHGPDRDDEINRLKGGGNYGWNPVPGYDQTVPMTDFSLPGKQIGAKWSSGFPTIAPSGAAWLHGTRWGDWNGSLILGVLKDETTQVFTFAANGDLQSVAEPAALDGTHGRIRAVTLGPDHRLYVTTDNGSGSDEVLKVTPTL